MKDVAVAVILNESKLVLAAKNKRRYEKREECCHVTRQETSGRIDGVVL